MSIKYFTIHSISDCKIMFRIVKDIFLHKWETLKVIFLVYLPLKNDCIVLFHGYHRGLDFFDHCHNTKTNILHYHIKLFNFSMFEYPYLLPKIGGFLLLLCIEHINYDLMLNLITLKLALARNTKFPNCYNDKQYIVSTSNDIVLWYHKISYLVPKM